MNRSFSFVFAAVCAAGLSFVSMAETWYWKGKTLDSASHYTWKEPLNWTNANNEAGTPRNGDTAVLGHTKGQNQPYMVCDASGTSYSAANAVSCVCWPGPYTRAASQGNYLLQAGGQGLQFLVDADSGASYSGVMLMGEGEVPIYVKYPNRNLVMQMRVLKKADANGKCNPILVKKGPGIFSCFYQGDNKPYDIPLTLIQQGVFNLTTERVLDGIQIRFDGDDPSQILEFNYSSTYHQDLTLKNGAITETNGVANAAHGIRAAYDHQLHFTGTPKVNPMVFSGTFYGGAGLSWEPVDANYVYVYSNAVSATTGRLDVVKGTVKLVQGASFTALGGLSVASDAVFEVESGSGEGLAANALNLGSSSAKLKLPEGVTLAAYSASLAGNALSPGIYTGAEGEEGTPVAWIEGAGTVSVETGPTSSLAWTGAGTDDLLTTPANWGVAELPDLTSGESFATFTTASPAVLPAGFGAAFSGLYLSGGFDFAAATGATPVKMGVDGLTTPDETESVVYNWQWPTEITVPQTWTIGANATFNLKAPLSGSGSVQITGAGALNLATTTDYAGGLDISTDAMHIEGVNALGTGTTPVRVCHDSAKALTFTSATNARPVNLYWQVSAGNENTVKFEGNNLFEGEVNVAGSTLFKAVDGGVAEFARKVKTDAEFRPQGNGRLIFRDTLSVGGTMYIASTASRGLVMDLYGTNNGFSHVFWTSLHYGRINTHVPYAISDYEGGYAQRFSIAPEFTLDLCGNDQKFGVLNSTGGTITSDEPAILHLVAKYEYHDYGDLGRTNLVAFTGAAGFSHEGKYTNRLNAVSSTVGTLQVTEGMLRLLPNAAWPNSTNCVVTGGTLAFEHSGALTTNTPIRVYGSGKLELAYEGTMTNGEFRLDGRRMSGTIGAPGSGARHECANIIGPGLLYVEPQGLQLFIR